MKKLLIILPSLEAGGAQKAIILLANTLIKNYNYKITFAVLDVSDFYENLIHENIEIIKLNIEVKKLKFYRRMYYFYFGYGFLISKKIDIKKYDLYLSAFERVSEYALAYLVISSFVKFSFIKQKCFCIIQTSIDGIINYSSNFGNKIITKVFNSVRMYLFGSIICVSQHIVDELVLKKNSYNNFCVIPNPIDFKSTRKLSLLGNYLLQKEYIIHIGRIVPQKNQMLLLKAFNSIKDMIDSDLIFLGSFQENILFRKLNKYIKENNLESRVHFLGALTNPFPIIKKAAISVVTSYYEGFPLSILESMYLKVPILSVKYSGYDSILTNDNAILSGSKNFKVLGEKILCLLNDEKRKEEIVKVAFRDVQKYDVNLIAEMYHNKFKKY